MTEFGLVRSFDIDDGQLDAIPSHQCFVLGYELAQIDAMLLFDDDFESSVRVENQDRIRKSCENAERVYSLTFMDDDVSASWMNLRVEPR